MNKFLVQRKNNDLLTYAIIIFIFTTSFFSFVSKTWYITIYRNAALVVLLGILSYHFIKKYRTNKGVHIDKSDFSLLFQLSLPFLIYYIYSFVLIIVSGESVIYLILRSTISIGMTIVVILIAFLLNLLYHKKALNIVTNSCLASNVIIAIYALAIRNFNFLEVHELTYVLGILFLFRWITNCGKFDITNCLLLLFILIGGKRITFLALSLCFLGYFIHKFLSKKFLIKKLLLFYAIILLLFVFGYSYFSTYGLQNFIHFCDQLDINTMGRTKLYLWAQKFYDGLHFFGHGIYYTNYGLLTSPIMTGFKAIHNDFLRIFIEGGLIFFIAYFVNYIVFQTKRLIKKYNEEIAFSYILLIAFTLFHYTTDNVFVYVRYILVFHFLIFYLCSAKKELVKDEVK